MKHTLTGLKVFTFLFVTISWHFVNGENPFRVHGNIGLFYDMYSYAAVGYDDFRPRHPSDLARLSAHATLSAGQHFSMPFAIDISNQSRAYHLPLLPEERLIDYVQNPRNNIHINPTYKWMQGYLGTQTPGFSALTTGNIPIFGVGLALNPGLFSFAAHYGRSQIAVNANPTADIAGAWEQRILAAQIGVGQQGATRFSVNVVHRKDDMTSLESPPEGLPPQEGVTISPHLQIRIAQNLLFSTETAGSVFTRDLTGPPLPFENDILDEVQRFVTVTGSTNMDFSNITSLEWQSAAFDIGAEVRYIGPGFEPVGFRTVERDLIDYNVKAGLRLLDNRLIVSGSVGLRENNLQNTTAESTSRIIANTNMFLQPGDVFSLAANFSNFGFRNNVLYDTLKVEMIQNMLTVTPGLQINHMVLNHTISATAGIQQFDEYNVVTGDFVKTQSTNLHANYTMLFANIPLNIHLMGMYLVNETPVMDLTLYHVGLTVRYRLFDNRLVPSVMISHSGIDREGFSTDHRWRFNARTNFKITETMDIRAGYTYSRYDYGSARPGANTSEHRLQLSLSQRL